ncbi:MAG TPA: hypothetical protein VFU22_25785, partial [Roseiflexaceae bacterium]|nr:hypothetical protein [Roseiflexaceae bacterium]
CALPLHSSEQIGQLQAEDIAALAAFDAPIFGAERPAVFTALLDEAPERAFIARDADGQISGYLFAQAQTLGPWAARSPAAAEALLATVLPLPFEGAPNALAPGPNADAAKLLMRYGFSPRRLLRRMRRGGDSHPGQRALLYGQASLAIG